MSQFTVVALTQLSKVLKEINLLFVSSIVLKEGALLTSCSVSWKETFFFPEIPMVLQEVSLPLFLTMSLTLSALSFSLMAFMPYTPGVLKGVNLCLSLSSAWCVGWGLERSLSAHLSDDSYAIYTKGLDMSQLVLLSPVSYIFGWGFEKSLSAHAHSLGLERTRWMVLKGLRCNSLVPQLCFAIYFQARVLKGISGTGICLVFCGQNRFRNIFA